MPSMSPSTEHHYPSHAMNREDLAVYLLALLVPLAFLGYGLWRVYVGYIQFGPAAVSAWGQPWFIAATWALIPLFFLTLRAVLLARRKVTLTCEGLVFTGMSPKPLRWNQLSGISIQNTRYHLLGLTLRTRHWVMLYPTTGRPIRLDDHFTDLPALAENIRKILYPLLLPDLQTQLQKGQWLYFGPIRFNPIMLEIGKRSLKWQQIQALSVKSGLLVIELNGRRPITLYTSRIPNLELLLQLVETLHAEN